MNPTESVTNINYSRQVGVSPDTTLHLRVARMYNFSSQSSKDVVGKSLGPQKKEEGFPWRRSC